MRSKTIIVLALSAVVFLIGAQISKADDDARVSYVREQLIKAGSSAESVNQVFNDPRLVIYPVTEVSYREPNWQPIRQKLFSLGAIRYGAGYLRSNQAIFEKAEADYGVSKEALTGLIAIETDFGRNVGQYSAFSVIYSRMVRWPEAKWQGQADQLVALATYCLQAKVDCYSIKSSYAGAIGLVQFMPNSLLAYGVDGDGDGTIDLAQPTDAIPSAANFLKLHGWPTDQAKSLARYYGDPVGYPSIVMVFASMLRGWGPWAPERLALR